MARRPLPDRGQGAFPPAHQEERAYRPGRWSVPGRAPSAGSGQALAGPAPVSQRVTINARGTLTCPRRGHRQGYDQCYGCPFKGRFGGTFGAGAWVECSVEQ